MPDQAEKGAVPVADDQDKAIAPVTAPGGEGLDSVDHAPFDEHSGLPLPCSMSRADNTCYDDSLPPSTMPDPSIARSLDSCAERGIVSVRDDHVAFDGSLGLPHLCYNVIHDPPMSWDDLYGRKTKRKLEKAEVAGGESLAEKRQRRISWSGTTLHEEFVEAVNQLGVDRATPLKILGLMNHPGLTKENVASHLQKYRNKLKKQSTQPEKVEAHIARFPESYNNQGHLRRLDSLRKSTDPPRFVPTMRQQPMNIGSMMREPSTCMKPRQIGGMQGFLFRHEPIRGHLCSLAMQMPQRRQNAFLPEQQSIRRLHEHIKEHYSRHRVIPDHLGHVNMGITGIEQQYRGFTAVAANVNNFDELDGNLRTRAGSFEALDDASSTNGAEYHP